MQYFLDDKVPLWMNIFTIMANGVNIIYNIPQMFHTYRTRTTKGISIWFLILRLTGNGIWAWYSFYIMNVQLIIANTIPVISTIFIGYYKIRELLEDRRSRITFSA